MKVGTVPKITAGTVAVIVLAFIGTRQFISSKEDSSLSVEVVTSSTETANSPAQTDATLKGVVTAPALEDKPQISTEEMEQIEDFFAQLDEADGKSEADTSHLPTDVAPDQGSDSGDVADSSIASEGAGLSVEEVMTAYVEAFRTLDSDVMLELMTVDLRETLTSAPPFPSGQVQIGEIPKHLPDEIPVGILENMLESELKVLEQQTFGRIEIVSHQYVGDEFRFRLRIQAADLSGILGIVAPEMSKLEMDKIEMPAPPDTLLKMRKENGAWRIYVMEG